MVRNEQETGTKLQAESLVLSKNPIYSIDYYSVVASSMPAGHQVELLRAVFHLTMLLLQCSPLANNLLLRQVGPTFLIKSTWEEEGTKVHTRVEHRLTLTRGSFPCGNNTHIHTLKETFISFYPFFMQEAV